MDREEDRPYDDAASDADVAKKSQVSQEEVAVEGSMIEDVGIRYAKER